MTIEWVLGLLATVITSVVTCVLIPNLVTWLKTKTQSERLHTVFAELGDTVSTGVSFIEQTFVKQMKKDGKWDAKSQRQAFSLALDYVLCNLTTTSKTLLENNIMDLIEFIGSRIEAEVCNRGELYEG